MKKIILLIFLTNFFQNIVVKAQWLGAQDTITFESNYNNLSVDTLQANNLWQVGTPHKVLFDSAFTTPNAIVTACGQFCGLRPLDCWTVTLLDSFVS